MWSSDICKLDHSDLQTLLIMKSKIHEYIWNLIILKQYLIWVTLRVVMKSELEIHSLFTCKVMIQVLNNVIKMKYRYVSCIIKFKNLIMFISLFYDY